MSIWSLITDILTQIPPVALVFPNEAGVFLRGGRLKKVLGPGFYWKIPWYDRIMKITVVEQVLNLTTQTVQSTKGETWTFGLTIRYEVDDVSRAILNVMDFDDAIQTLAMSTLASYASRVEELTYDGICKEVLEVLSTEAEEWGLDVFDIGLTDYCKVKTFRLITGGD